MRDANRTIVVFTGVLIAAACAVAAHRRASAAEPDGRGSAAAAAAAAAAAQARDERLMRAIAAEYTTWGRADEQARRAPEACEPGVGGVDGTAGRISRVDAPETAHVRKLYLLFARDKPSYLAVTRLTEDRGGEKPAPATRPAAKADDALAECKQVVVKEAWAPVEVTADEAKTLPVDRKAHKGQQWYKAGGRGDLFVMARSADDKAAGTDGGWVYGVVTPGSTPIVQQAGVLRQCAECHQQAGAGRLYGVRRGE